MGLGKLVADTTSAAVNDLAIIQVFSDDTNLRRNSLYRKRPKWIARQAPTFKMRDRYEFLGNGEQAIIMSVPSFNDMISPHESVNNTYWQKLNVKLKEPSNREHIKRLIDACFSDLRLFQARNIEIYSYYDDKETLDEIKLILDVVFNGIMAITMFLSFFSLCASVSGNLMDQTKEIGILRSLGCTSRRIKTLFVYEAFVLVSASSFQGLLIGVMVGTTLMA